jgi:D-alanyl-lipoteichoic acid acyltransferase DltB (MBOAT superfamily)
VLFNSYTFLIAFLPVTLAGFYAIRRFGRPGLEFAWLFAASVVFYGWNTPQYLLVLLPTIAVNFVLGDAIRAARDAGRQPLSRLLLLAGICCNLGVLGYFKYANFFLENLSVFTGGTYDFGKVLLPLGISFFTFQQIAYLTDQYNDIAARPSFLRYAVLVSFFPQLIAGPIVHHREMLPQLHRPDEESRRRAPYLFATGVTIFAIGLAKKTVIADTVAQWASPVFNAAARGETITFLNGWAGSFAYSFQIYFDFSAYSDMAIGLGLMFGIMLPINFDSPYKAVGIIDFWRRWHITLSRFLKDHLYIPLGGNRKGLPRRYANLMVTMLLGGLWHGAAWTFVAWGAIHGALLMVNHAWRRFAPRKVLDWLPAGGRRGSSRVITFLAVTVAWIFFRSEDFETAWRMIEAITGQNGIVLPALYASPILQLGIDPATWGITFGLLPYFDGATEIVTLALLLAVVWAMPNSQQIVLGDERPLRTAEASVAGAGGATGLIGGGPWKPTWRWGLAAGAVFGFAVLGLSQVSEFIYFRF